MTLPGDRDTRVTIKLLPQDTYDRIRPQSGRRFRAFQSLRGEYCRDVGEGNRQPGSLPQRRGGSGRAGAFFESAADGRGEADRVCGLSGSAADKELLSCLPIARWQVLRGGLPCLLLLLAALSLSGCGGHKTEVQVPPPPVLPQPGTESGSATTATDRK